MEKNKRQDHHRSCAEAISQEWAKAKSRRRDTEVIKPVYPCDDYEGFCAHQKQKGLMRKYWKELPAMWEKEKKFRRRFEKALN